MTPCWPMRAASITPSGRPRPSTTPPRLKPDHGFGAVLCRGFAAHDLGAKVWCARPLGRLRRAVLPLFFRQTRRTLLFSQRKARPFRSPRPIQFPAKKQKSEPVSHWEDQVRISISWSEYNYRTWKNPVISMVLAQRARGFYQELIS